MNWFQGHEKIPWDPMLNALAHVAVGHKNHRYRYMKIDGMYMNR